jgi:uncharacterized protein (TIGR03663 family)
MKRWFLLGILLLAAAAAASRLPRLAQRPMHCDEANQAVLAGTLFDTGVYRYDPFEYHGPTMPWLAQPALWLDGTKDYAHSRERSYRLVPLAFSVGLILLLLAIGDGLGPAAALLAAVLTLLSPVMAFYGRCYIHETLLVFFTFATIACGWRYFCTRSLGWAALAGASLGLMYSTKETWILAAAAMAAGLTLAVGWNRLAIMCRKTSSRHTPCAASDGTRRVPATLVCGPAIVAAALAAVLVALACYSSFGTNGRGPLDSLLAYAVYWRRGSQSGIHTHPWYYYLQLLFAYRPARGFFWSEALIGILALIGCGAGLTGKGIAPQQRSLMRFLAFYTLVLTALYAAIPYKTPWCLLSFLHGMILLGGVGAWIVLRAAKPWPLRLTIGLLLAAGLAHLGYQNYLLNFRYDADQRNPWVYAATSPDVRNLVRAVDRIAAPSGQQLTIHVVMPDNYWPLPWYLRQFGAERVGYWHDPAAWAKDSQQSPPPAMLILTADAQPTVNRGLRAAYNKQMLFGLRPGVLVSVYVREDLCGKGLEVRD